MPSKSRTKDLTRGFVYRTASSIKSKWAFKNEKAGRFYPADDAAVKKSRGPGRKVAKLRASITPGTVLILLAGRFRGKRVVFLKQLSSGLLLVTGPYQVNGVPLRRVNQAYVIATSTKVDVSGVDVSNIDDAFFAREASAKKSAEEQFFATAEKKEVSAARKAAQEAVDGALLPAIEKVEFLKAYLQARFSLSNGQAPHTLKF